MRSVQPPLVLAGLFLSSSALADPVTVTFNGVTSGTSLTVYRPGASALATSAGTMAVSIEGDEYDAYCVDLDHFISAGASYSAELVPMEAEDPWCAAGWILAYAEPDDATSAAAVQVALWKLLYPGLTVSSSAVDAEADALVAESDGTCPLTCGADVSVDALTTDQQDGTVLVEIAVSQADHDTVAGQELSLSVSGGALLDPADGVAVTDEDGLVLVTVDPGTAGAFTLTATLDGRTLYRIEPTTSVQQLLAFTYETCTYEGEASWEATPLGDPGTIGFWKHQAAVATGASRGKAQVPRAVLESFLPLDIFGTSFDTVSDLYATLWLGKATMAQRAVQQCLATRLNVAYGEAGWFTDIDLDGDGTSDGLLWELWAEAEAAYEAGEYEAAKDICDTFNNL